MQLRWGWIGALVFVSLIFYGVPRVQSAWNIAGLVLAAVMSTAFGVMAYRAHRHIREAIERG